MPYRSCNRARAPDAVPLGFGSRGQPGYLYKVSWAREIPLGPPKLMISNWGQCRTTASIHSSCTGKGKEETAPLKALVATDTTNLDSNLDPNPVATRLRDMHLIGVVASVSATHVHMLPKRCEPLPPGTIYVTMIGLRQCTHDSKHVVRARAASLLGVAPLHALPEPLSQETKRRSAQVTKTKRIQMLHSTDKRRRSHI